MSNSLVKQSLSLFDDDITDLQPGIKKRKSTDPMKQISTKKKGVKKELKKLQTRHQRNKPQSSKKSSLKEHQWSRPETDYTEYSVKALKRLEKIKAADPGTATAVVDHHHRVVSRARTRVKDTDKPSDNDTSAFTEDDFKTFAEEYDFK